MTPFQERLRGSIPALVTAMNSDLTVDADGMRRIARRLLDNGSRGVVTLGTSGEFAGIDDDQRETAIRAVVSEVDGQAPVIVGCGQPNVRRTHEQAKAAGDLGADGILVNPPYYFPMSQDEVVSFFADLVKASPVPVMLYNIPSMTKVSVEPATIPRLRDVGVQGCKDSSGLPANTLAYLAALGNGDDFRVVVGGETFFLHLLDAGVCATTGLLPNVTPQLTSRVHDEWEKGAYKAGLAAQHATNAFASTFRALGPFLPAVAKGILSCQNVVQRWVAPPKVSLTEDEARSAFEAVESYLP